MRVNTKTWHDSVCWYSWGCGEINKTLILKTNLVSWWFKMHSYILAGKLVNFKTKFQVQFTAIKKNIQRSVTKREMKYCQISLQHKVIICLNFSKKTLRVYTEGRKNKTQEFLSNPVFLFLMIWTFNVSNHKSQPTIKIRRLQQIIGTDKQSSQSEWLPTHIKSCKTNC